MKETAWSACTSVLESVLEPLLRNRIYVEGAGRLTAGLRRRGGLGFMPKKAMTPEHMFLKRLDLKGKTVYDVGGYIGLITMFFAREVGETGRVITFEPNPQNYRAILDHVNLNGFTNVRVMQMGLGSKRETLKFVVSDRLSARGTADPARQEQLLGQGRLRVLEIEIDAMDNQIVVNNLPKPDFIKIDVEGLELDVLRGMSQTISHYRPEMLIELHGTGQREIVELLLSHGYNIHQIEDGIDITPQSVEMAHGHVHVH